MSDIQGDAWADNPFTFGKILPLPDVQPQPVPITNILRDCFTKLKTKFVQMPPAKINPLEPIGTENWTPEMSLSNTLTDRFAPNPAFMLGLKRKDEVSSQGTKGWNTHYNLVLDQSSSMKESCSQFEGTNLNRSLVTRIAASCLIKQASFNTDSFTVYSYNDTGRIAFPLPAGDPSYDYQGGIAWLTAASISSLWNITQSSQGEVSYVDKNEVGTDLMITALAAIAPIGLTNHQDAMECLIDNMTTKTIQGCITLYMTDGDGIFNAINQTYDKITPTCYDEWLRQFGHVFYIILDSSKIIRNVSVAGRLFPEGTKGAIVKEHQAIVALSKVSGMSAAEASRFVWTFPNDKMLDPATNLPFETITEQMAWLFAEIGKIFAGTSEEFLDLGDKYGVIVNPDGSKGSYERPDTD